MSSPDSNVQVLGISNAIVDVLAHVDDEFLIEIGAPRGSMTLIDTERAQEIYLQMGPATEMSGGSVANTIAGIANLGGEAAYIGRVADDQLGGIFVHDMQSLGVDVRLPPSPDGAPTSRSFVLISPDGQRTMQTYLGACLELSTTDISATTVGEAGLILLEGYVWDTPHGQEAVELAMDIADAKGAQVAISLSDDQCVLRHNAAFLDAVRNRVAIVFANEEEIQALLEADSFDDAVSEAAGIDTLFALTRSEHGSVIVDRSETIVQEAIPVDRVIDATGAGDAYSAAFLYGLTSGQTLAECARLASHCAAAVIQQVGARVEKDFLAGYLRSHSAG